jgi:uncharacterized protein YjbI with pentapeptide repeats
MIRVVLALFAIAAVAAAHAGDTSYLREAGLQAGNCPHCNLAGRDLTNQCLKGANLAGADFERARLSVACLSYAKLDGASFRGADLGGANLAHAAVDGADFSGANLTITSLRGTDLRRAKGLTQVQLNRACGDNATKLPAGLTVKVCD